MFEKKGLREIMRELVLHPYRGRILINKLDLERPWKNGLTPIQYAISQNWFLIVNELYKIGGLSELPDSLKEDVLRHSYIVPDIFNYIIESRDKNIHEINKDGQTLLMKTAMHGVFESCTILIEKGANIDIQDYDGNTALHYAIKNGNDKIVKLLIQKGTDVTLKNNNKETPLSLVTYNHDLINLGFLLQSGAGRDSTQFDYIPNLATKAIQQGHNDVANMFIRTKEGLDWLNSLQNTLMAEACIQNNREVIYLITKKHPNLSKDRISSKYVVMRSILNDDIELIKLLISLKVDLDIIDRLGNTPLIWSCRQGSFDLVKILLKAKVSIDMANNDGLTAKDIAINLGNSKIVSLLNNYN